jgi:hypothetical protein
MSTHNLLNFETDLEVLQNTIVQDERIFRNWNMQTDDKRSKGNSHFNLCLS